MHSSGFRKIVRITLISCYLLILAGSVVRATGSGLGCPDWPKCFGEFIPPTDIAELPSDYKQRFAIAGKEIADFDPFKTWVEYLNRLLGVVVGFEMLLLVIFSFNARSAGGSFFGLSLTTFLLTAAQGFIGAKVVSSNLSPYLITVHMVVAIIILFLLHYIDVQLNHKSDLQYITKNDKSFLFNIAWVTIILSLVQLVLGTQVRQGIDTITNNSPELPRSEWLSEVGNIFLVHRSSAILILLFNILLIYKMLTTGLKGFNLSISKIIIFLIGTIASGMVLAYKDVLVYAQPTHLLICSMYLGVLFTTCIRFRKL